MTTEQTLAWEAERRSKVALATIAAAVLTALGTIVGGLALGAVPDYEDRVLTVVDTLRLAAEGRPIPPGAIAAQAMYIGDHAVLPILGAVLFGLGSVLVFPVMAYLFRAARARTPSMPQFTLIVAAVGAVAYGVGRGVGGVARYVGAMQFADQADHSNQAANEALNNGVAMAASVISGIGALAFGFGFVLISLNAMKVGLLTRFMGMMGVIVGVTFVLPLDSQGILRVFWLAALAALIAGRWPKGMPPAWTTGNAEPWPTQQQLREQREAARGGGRPGVAGADGASAATPAPRPPRRPEPTTSEPHSSSKKRKRKRRS